MRVLFVSRYDWERNWGGDTVQMLYIKKYLVSQGVFVDIEVNPFKLRQKVKEYDLIHIFNIQRLSETLFYCDIVKSAGKKLILSPIYGEDNYTKKFFILNLIGESCVQLTKDLFRTVVGAMNIIPFTYSLSKYGYRSLKNKVKSILESADLIVPNSNYEASLLINLINVHPSKIRIIYNGVDPGILNIKYSMDDFLNDFRVPFRGKFVLSVSRFVFRKNVLNLIKAVEGTDIKLVLIAQRSPINKLYYEKCKKIIDRSSNIYLIEKKVDTTSLVGAYKACHVHALVSYLETPGLANLEAGLFGANLVLGECLPVREYFGEYALYCNQEEIQDIREKLFIALGKDKNDALSSIIKEKYSWEKIGKHYLDAYKSLYEKG